MSCAVISGRQVLLSFDVARCARARVANMQVITAIYLNCRPDLRDEWLTGIEVDDVYDAQVSRGRSLAESAHLLTSSVGSRAGTTPSGEVLYVPQVRPRPGYSSRGVP